MYLGLKKLFEYREGREERERGGGCGVSEERAESGARERKGYVGKW